MSDKLSYGIKEAAAALGLKSRTSVYKMINEGKLSTKKLGSRTVIPRADLEALLT